jgi:hypothetical protein
MKQKFNFAGCEVTVDTDKMSEGDRQRLAAQLFDASTPANRTQALVLASEADPGGRGLDRYLQATGRTFEQEAEKCGLFDEKWPTPAPPPSPEISEETARKASSLDDEDLAKLLDFHGMFNHKTL